MKEPEIFRAEIPLVEPHFDEEATVLNARPVVPLETVRAASRSRRTLFLVLALTGALMMGAVGGTLIYKQRATNRGEVVSQPAEQSAEVAPATTEDPSVLASGGTTSAVEESIDDLEETESQPKRTADNESSTRNVSIKPPASPARARVNTAPIVRDEPDQNERRQAKKEARRLRREARREARTRQDSDDLMRIRDIFEGSPRP